MKDSRYVRSSGGIALVFGSVAIVAALVAPFLIAATAFGVVDTASSAGFTDRVRALRRARDPPGNTAPGQPHRPDVRVRGRLHECRGDTRRLRQSRAPGQDMGGMAHGMAAAARPPTLAVAALFRPLRARGQSFIDRRFYRGGTTQTVETFSRRLRDDVDLDSMRTDLLQAVQRTMQPDHVSLWLMGPHTQNVKADRMMV